MLKKRKVSKLFIKSAMEHALHLRDVIAIDSKNHGIIIADEKKHTLVTRIFSAPK